MVDYMEKIGRLMVIVERARSLKKAINSNSEPSLSGDSCIEYQYIADEMEDLDKVFKEYDKYISKCIKGGI